MLTKVYELLITQLHIFSINFINVLSYYRCIRYLVFPAFPSISMVFMYGDINLEIVKKFNYLGIVFTPGGSFSKAHATLSGQALKAIFAMNRH